jgi:hypothetical protein
MLAMLWPQSLPRCTFYYINTHSHCVDRVLLQRDEGNGRSRSEPGAPPPHFNTCSDNRQEPLQPLVTAQYGYRCESSAATSATVNASHQCPSVTTKRQHQSPGATQASAPTAIGGVGVDPQSICRRHELPSASAPWQSGIPYQVMLPLLLQPVPTRR